MDGKELEDDVILITIKEACRITNIGRNTMLKLSKTKGFPAFRFKRKKFIDRGELPNWIGRNYGSQWFDKLD